MQLGEKVKDAYTKESLGKSETKIGTVEIIQVSPKQSKGKASLTDANTDLEKGFKPKMYILRLNNSSKKQALKKKTNILVMAQSQLCPYERLRTFETVVQHRTVNAQTQMLQKNLVRHAP